jgi:hypothetical protein
VKSISVPPRILLFVNRLAFTFLFCHLIFHDIFVVMRVVCMFFFFFSKPGSSIKQHKRNNSDGLELPVKPNASVSCQDLSTLSVYSSGLVAEPANVRRFGAADSANNDADSLSSIDSASLSEAVVSLKPEVNEVQMQV